MFDAAAPLGVHSRVPQVRTAFERLGPTYIKAGQVLSVRPDLLPPEAVHELAKLQGSVQEFASQAAFQEIEAELKAPLSTVLSQISKRPMAAGSLAQVHNPPPPPLPRPGTVPTKRSPGTARFTGPFNSPPDTTGKGSSVAYMGMAVRPPIPPPAPQYCCDGPQASGASAAHCAVYPPPPPCPRPPGGHWESGHDAPPPPISVLRPRDAEKERGQGPFFDRQGKTIC